MHAGPQLLWWADRALIKHATYDLSTVGCVRAVPQSSISRSVLSSGLSFNFLFGFHLGPELR